MKKEVLEKWISQFEVDRKTLEQSDKSESVLRDVFSNLHDFKDELNQTLNHKNVAEMRVWNAVKDVAPTLKSLQTFFYADFGSLEIWRRSITS